MPLAQAVLHSFRLPLFLLGVIGVCTSLSAVVPIASSTLFPTELHVTGGTIRGQAMPSGAGIVFKGIPFAQPPVGERRWHEPAPVIPWTGVRDAGKSGPPAVQAPFGWNNHFAVAGNEDCLYLDVSTPATTPNDRLPVMVWIHGGSNLAGAGGADRLYQGDSLITHGVVLVVIEYRVGIFGFFAHPELTSESSHRSSGNYGLLDQIAALQWVHDNIARFGGNPANVTLFGQSAGSMDILTLMTSPLARGLFHRAIAESGPAPYGMMSSSLTQAEHAGELTAAELNAPTKNSLAFLRSLPTEKLVGIKTEIHPLCVDGWVLPAVPSTVFFAGKESPIPLLIGSMAVEFAMGGSSLSEMKQTALGIFGDLAPKALKLYELDGPAPANPDPRYGTTAEQVGSDAFRCASIVQAEVHHEAGNEVWEYEFDRAIPPHEKAVHSGELPYVFGNFFSSGDLSGNFSDADRKLSATMQAYWTNFARTGNPNGADIPEWPAYETKSRKYLQFTPKAQIIISDSQRAPFSRLYRQLLTPKPISN